jgi:UDP-N-acetyl-D-mannosaminuronic acid dehydrogenase
MKTTCCIVGGCGHVGLPLGIALAEVSPAVTLLDVDAARIAEVRDGHMPFIESGGEERLRAALASGRLTLTTDRAQLSTVDVVIVTIGTPIDEYLDPDVSHFDRALRDVLAHMSDGQLLILRSTIFPGMTERLGRQAREQGLSIDVSHCPERVAQGHSLEELRLLPQIVGGITESATRRSAELFIALGARIIELTPAEAELAKLFSNAYRYINFAISNQFYSIANRFGADFYRIHEACTYEYPRMRGFAQAGFSGGPCLLKDTMQLAAFNHTSFALGQAAMMVNEGLPMVLVESVKARHDLAPMTAAILGMAFKGDNDDTRDSLAFKLRKLLLLECRRVICSDPYVRDPSFVSTETALAEADIIFVGACHTQYRHLHTSKPVIDVFNFVKSGKDTTP